MVDNTNRLDSANEQTIKRIFNMLMRKSVLDENTALTESDKQHINNYKDQDELWTLYSVSENKFSSFKEMILSF